MRYVFIHKKQDTLRYAIFMKILKLAFIYIQKEGHFALRDVFKNKKPDTSKKARQFASHFLYVKSLTLFVMQFFMEFLKLAEGGWHFYKQKTMQFALNFYLQKTLHFP